MRPWVLGAVECRQLHTVHWLTGCDAWAESAGHRRCTLADASLTSFPCFSLSRHAVHVRGGLIASVAAGLQGADRHVLAKRLLAGRPLPLLDFGDAVLAPGLVDVHVHMNEPGREEWEGALAGQKTLWMAS